MKILVTGGAGAIGGNLVRVLENSNVLHVIILDNLSRSQLWNVPKADKIQYFAEY